MVLQTVQNFWFSDKLSAQIRHEICGKLCEKRVDSNDDDEFFNVRIFNFLKKLNSSA